MDHGQSMAVLWRAARAMVRRAADAMPADGYGFRPATAVRTFAEQVLHVVESGDTLVDAIDTGRWRWDWGYTADAYPTKNAVLALLDERTDRLLARLSSLSEADLARVLPIPWHAEAERPSQPTVLFLLGEWVLHEGHHLGQLVMYLRLRGITPPPYG